MKVITVGRSQECNVVVNDEKASRVHLQLVQDDNGNVSVVDLGSTNGTWVNDKRIVGEMRLNQGDRIRVGDTLLQWQNYIAANSGDREVPANTDKDAAPSHGSKPPKPNRTLMWIIIAVVAALIVAGGVIWIVHEQHVKNGEKEVAERNAKERVEQSEMAVIEAEARSDYNNALRQAAEKEKNNALDEKERAIKAKEEADKTTQKAMKAKEKSAKQEKVAIAAKNKAVEEKEKAIKEQNEAKGREQKALAERNAAIAKARQDSLNAENAERRARLTEEFYSQLNKANKDGKLKEVCETLKIDTKKYKKNEEQYDSIVGKFKSAKDNATRESIINSIKKALSKKKEPSKKAVETSTPKSVQPDSTQDEKNE